MGVKGRVAQLAAGTLAFAVGGVATAVVMLLILQAGDLVNEVSSDLGTALLAALRFAIPIGGGLLLARAVVRKVKQQFAGDAQPSRSNVTVWRRAQRVLIAAYVVTWFLGAPVVQTSLDNGAFQRWKALEAQDHKPGWQVFPYIRTLIALPIAPGLIVTYHEYQVAPLYGWGGWQVHLWYGGGVKQLARLTVWVS